MGHVVYAVLQDLNFVSLAGQGVGAYADFTLASGTHFVVVYFNFQSHGFHGGTHGTTQVVQAVDRRNREVAAFYARAVANVVAIEVFAGNPGRFFGVDVVRRALHVHIPFNGIEYEELRLRTKQGAISDAGGLQVFFSATGNRAGVALITLHGRRLYDVAGNVDGGFFGERVQHGGFVIRHQDHVGFVDAFPAGNGRAVKHLAVGEEVIVYFAGWQSYVLFFTAAVGEAQINPFDFVFFDQINRLGHCACSVVISCSLCRIVQCAEARSLAGEGSLPEAFGPYLSITAAPH